MASHTIPPVCQLLERGASQLDSNACQVAVPLAAAAFLPHLGGVWVTDLAVAKVLEQHGQQVQLGLAAPAQCSDGALLFWPKSHALGLWWLQTLCHWLPEGAPIEIVGEHQGGIKRVPKVLEAAGLECARLDNARRCSLFATRAKPVDIAAPEWGEYSALELKLATHPGVFANGRLDAGTDMLLTRLAQEFPKGVSGSALDVGCGDGIISLWLARAGAEVTALDVDAFAVETTRRSLALNGMEGSVAIGDMLEEVAESFDVIVSNPPFHQARDVDIGPARRLIEQAPSRLRPGGKLYIVANVFLPYRAALEACFERVDTLEEDGRYRIYRASSPRRTRKR
ncbi:methyltransferase [Carnimonas bestiolae]|uniref:methyltransferase n=1 Tax=Carnimonas bestiolae TaxID=3402172 RepID=UPI003EDBF68F